MNKELGRKVLDHVTAHREQFDMAIWANPPVPECGTTACLGGWAILLTPGYKLAGHDRFTRPDGTEVKPYEIAGEAKELLQLTDAEYYGDDDLDPSVFGEADEDVAITRFRALVEAAEAAS